MIKRKHINPLGMLGWILTLLVFFPLYIMAVNSFKSRGEIFTSQLSLPSTLNFTYYAQAIAKMQFFNALKNSLLVTVVSVVFVLLLASMASWVLVRKKTKISTLIFYLFVSTMLIPFQSIMIPLVQYMNKWDIKALHFSMMDTLYGLVFMNIGFGLSLAIFLYHGFIKVIPLEIEEAATIDGCNRFQLFWGIVFPNLKPVTVTVAILNVIALWNDYLLPSLVLMSPGLKTIPLSTFYFFGEFTIEWNLALAGLVMTVIPVVIFYLCAQKYIIKGVIAGAVK